MTKILIIDEARYFTFSNKTDHGCTIIFEDSKSSLTYKSAEEYLASHLFDIDRVSYVFQKDLY